MEMHSTISSTFVPFLFLCICYICCGPFTCANIIKMRQLSISYSTFPVVSQSESELYHIRLFGMQCVKLEMSVLYIRDVQ